MNLNHLRWALEVERTGSFTAAANALFVAQSNLSSGIKALEEDIGFPIFVRRARGVEVTPLGQDFLDSIRYSVSHLKNVEAAYEHHTFSFAFHRHCSFLAAATAEVSRRHSGEQVRYIMRECSEMDILDSVYSGQSMFGVNFYPAESEKALQRLLLERNLSKDDFLTCGMKALVRQDHPLTRAPHFTMNELHRYPAAAFYENETKTAPFSSQTKEIGLDFDSFHTLIGAGDRATLYDLLQKTDAVFLTGLISREDLARYGLVLLPIDGFVRKYAVITPNNCSQPAVCRELIAAIRDAAQRLL